MSFFGFTSFSGTKNLVKNSWSYTWGYTVYWNTYRQENNAPLFFFKSHYNSYWYFLGADPDGAGVPIRFRKEFKILMKK